MLLHGYLASCQTFISQINYFSKYYKVTAFDFLGMGESDKLISPFNIDDYVNLTLKILNNLNIQKADIIAHSFGARVAIKLCDKYPERIKKMVFVGGAGIKPRFSLKKQFKILSYKIMKKFLSEEKLKNFGSSDYKQLSPIMKRSFNYIIKEDLKKYLKNIHKKVLLIYGENDKETPLYMAKKMEKGIKNSRLIIFKNAGHFAFIDRRDSFNIIVKSFLKEKKGG